MNDLLFEDKIISLHPKLKALTHFFSDDVKDREDLLKDTILIALLRQGDFEEGSNLLTWLTNIMKNKFIANKGVIKAKISRLPSYISHKNIG